MNFLLTQYNESHFKLIEYKEDYKFLSRHYKLEYSNNNSIYNNNLSRACSTIKEIALCNDFNFFGTITLKDNRYDLDSSQTLLKKYLHKLKRKFKDFRFLIITEKHKDGAFHFHGLFNITDNNFFYSTTILNQKNHRFYHGFRSKFFDDLGRNYFEQIKDKNRVSSYITKYITKNPIKSFHNQLYFCSRGLARADKTYLKNDKIDKIFSNRKIYENDVLKVVEFDLKDLSREEMFELMYASENDKENVINKEVEQVKLQMKKYFKKAIDFYNN